MVQGLEIVLIFLTPARAVPSHKYGLARNNNKRINLVSVWRILLDSDPGTGKDFKVPT